MALSDLNAIDAKLVENISFRKWSTLASLAVLSWEYILTSGDEFRHIWRRPITVVKITYIFSRYFALVVQSVNFYLVSGPLWSVSIHETVCRKWFVFLITAACCLMAALDLILMLRIYALYLKDVRIAALLVLLFCAQIAVDAVLSPRMTFNVPFDCICDTTKTHPDIMYFCTSIWVTHLPLVILMVAKRNLTQLGVPVARVVTRDGAWIIIPVFSLFSAIAPYSFISQVSKAHIVFSWPISLLSIACCRMIMNMLKLHPITEDRESIASASSDLAMQTLQVISAVDSM
ncbi:hypothetical protein BDZ97DRAFT_226354 [Flammula alnicola]|nr:hypothetical protein BDZ97DRAFT_598646 [Flammula alnicola]KAF8955993.1 hypothetical protein BDZ97DRAFT_226354 [Flammula alnicola]